MPWAPINFIYLFCYVLQSQIIFCEIQYWALLTLQENLFYPISIFIVTITQIKIMKCYTFFLLHTSATYEHYKVCQSPLVKHTQQFLSYIYQWRDVKAFRSLSERSICEILQNTCTQILSCQLR